MAKDLLRRWFERGLSWLCRNECPACRDERPFDRAFCTLCEAKRSPTLLDEAGALPIVALGAYAAPLDRAVRAFKYDGAVELAHPLGRELGSWARQVAPSFDLVVPVPLHPARLVTRGYNQAALLGREVARTLEIEFSPCALERARNTSAQAKMRKGERRANVAGVFVARGSSLARGRRVALVDDVVTTGETSLECCSALSSAGLEPVAILAIARAGGVGPWVEAGR